MTVIINKKNAGELDALIKQLKTSTKKTKRYSKPFDAMKYCGVVKVNEDAMAIQKRLRDEWR